MLTLIPCLCSCCSIHLKAILSYLFTYLLNKFNSSPKAHLNFYILQEVLPDAPKWHVISLTPNGILLVPLPSLSYYEPIMFLRMPRLPSIHGRLNRRTRFTVFVSSNLHWPTQRALKMVCCIKCLLTLRIPNAMWSTFWIMVFLLSTKELGYTWKKGWAEYLFHFIYEKGKR